MGKHQQKSWVQGLRVYCSDRERLAFFAGLAILSGIYFVLAVLAGYRLLNSGHFWPPDVLLGFDIQQTMDSLTLPNYNVRNNVHPLFAFLLKPLGLLITDTGLVTRGVAAIILNAAFGVLGLWLIAFYLRLRHVGRLDAFLVALVMAGSINGVCNGSIPNPPCFSLCLIALLHCLLVWSLRRPDTLLIPARRWLREGLWVVCGLVTYGLTVTNGFIAFLAYGFSRKGLHGWARAVGYGALVLALGLVSAWLVGSSTDLLHEKHFIVDHQNHGAALPYPGYTAASTFLVTCFVAPELTQTISADDRAVTCSVYRELHFTDFGWVLCMVWLGLLGLMAWQVWREDDPLARRCNLALIAGLAFNIVLHRFYYLPFEGVFFWGGHTLFLVLGLFASLCIKMQTWPVMRLTALRLTLFILGLIFFGRHFLIVYDYKYTIPLPPGFGG